MARRKAADKGFLPIQRRKEERAVKRPLWTVEEERMALDFLFGRGTALPEGRSGAAIRKKFAKHFEALRQLRQQTAPCHAATRDIYARIKSANGLRGEGFAQAELELAVKAVFCMSRDLPRGNEEAARGRALAWQHAPPQTRKRLNAA